MKKFISFVMAGAMVASLVPATAFAKGEVTATAKVVDALELTKDEAKAQPEIKKGGSYTVPQVQLKVTGVDYRTEAADASVDVEFTLDNAEFNSTNDADLLKLISIKNDEGEVITNDVNGGTEAVVEHYKNVSTSATGKFMVAKSKVSETKVSVSDVKKIPTFEEIPAKTVQEQLADLISQGYVITDTPVLNGTGDKYTAGTVAKSGSIKELKDLDATSIVSVADQENTWISANAPTTDYERCDATYVPSSDGSSGEGTIGSIKATVKESDDESVTFTFKGEFKKDYVIAFTLDSKLTKTSEGTKATVSVDSKMVTADDLVYASVLGKGLKASVKKTVDVATDEVVTLNSNGLKIEAAVGNLPTDKDITLRISNGFEFTKKNPGSITGTGFTVTREDEKELKVRVSATTDEITIKGIEIEAVSAKSGAVATITVKASNNDSASVEVAKVVDYKVNLTVDADEDIPVIYSGTNVANAGLTDDSEHESLEVTAKESFPGAWSMRQGFNFNLPEGVYVTDVDVVTAKNFKQGTNADNAADEEDWKEAFFNAYQKGDHKNFEFEKRVFNDVDTTLAKDPAELTFKLTLVADPTFEGDVKLAFEGALVDKQEVTIAKFVKPYTVKAEQNDVIIDYRNTEVKTPIVITEAEEGLWEKNATFKLSIEDDLLTFEDDPTFTIDNDSDLKLKDDKTTKGTIQFAVKETSDKAASVTISDMKLFMSRSIPAGAYDLEIATTMSEAYDAQLLFAPDQIKEYAGATDSALKVLQEKWTAKTSTDKRPDESTVKKDSYVDDVCDYSDVVKAAFINVVTSGRDNDNLFTTKVVVPVGEAYLLAGEAKVELDAPAYISAAGYTMLPVRAISKALGVNTNNVLWNAETRTVTVMYAQRIITMTVGQKSVYVNGSPIPTSAAPEIKDGRTFLPLRDLGTALGVTNVNWDAATKTATLN
ncbi:hypothetical protein DSECCO2_337730 [anaerobic digester metagenome]